MLSSSLDRAVTCIREGGIVAFPTETYYGLAVDPESLSAVTKLFNLKRREANKPLLLLVESVEQLQLIVENIPTEFIPIMEKYWPGPLTLVFRAKKEISRQLTGDTGTVGARISSHPVADELVRRMGKPITATSANISGHLPASTATEVLSMFGDSLSHIIDGGQTPGGLCSTVLGLQGGKCTVLRQGQIELSADLR
ncbi:MAG: threonylcarbamoyl-AMP synthase [Proteobacteria bacterium]|nr:threonylcarbamoyl-AMP synthase [Pseudomonadota bacterium]